MDQSKIKSTVTVGKQIPPELLGKNSSFKNISEKQWQEFLAKHDG